MEAITGYGLNIFFEKNETQSIGNDIAPIILKYIPDLDLHSLRSVNTKCKELCLDAYKDKAKKGFLTDLKQFKNMENERTHIKQLQEEKIYKQAEITGYKKNIERTLTKTRLSSFINTYYDGHSILSRIIHVIARLFPAIQNEIDTQNKSKEKISAYRAENAQLTHELTDLSKRLFDLNQKIAPLKIDYDLLVNSCNAVQHIYKLFGGKKNFLDLPVLDIGTRQGNTGYIDFIKPEEMTAPIMRGKDKFNRLFFVIRGRFKGDNNLRCQAFFQRTSVSHLNWTDGFSPQNKIISIPNYLISNGIIQNYRTYNELVTLIKDKAADILSLNKTYHFHLE